MRSLQTFFCAALLVLTLACAKSGDEASSGAAGGAGSAAAGGAAGSKAATAAKPVSIPEGTVLTVKLDQAVGTAISHAGDEFSASLAEPVEKDGTVLIPEGAAAKGVVRQAVPKGRFKGAAVLEIALKSVTVNGAAVPIETSSVERTAKGKGKRTATVIGGGAGLGALIGGLAGGGRGAAIGAAAGAGAGTAGAAYTGNRDITIPAEAAISFKLLQPVEVKK